MPEWSPEMTNVERRGRISHGCLWTLQGCERKRRQRARLMRPDVSPAGTVFGTQFRRMPLAKPVPAVVEGGGPLEQNEGSVVDRFRLGNSYDEGAGKHPMRSPRMKSGRSSGSLQKPQKERWSAQDSISSNSCRARLI